MPYNRDLLLKFQCHINLEVCNNSRSLKYLFKYCLKGHDNATMLLQKKKELTNLIKKMESEKQLTRLNTILMDATFVPLKLHGDCLVLTFIIDILLLKDYQFMFPKERVSLLNPMPKIFKKLPTKQIQGKANLKPGSMLTKPFQVLESTLIRNFQKDLHGSQVHALGKRDNVV